MGGFQSKATEVIGRHDCNLPSLPKNIDQQPSLILENKKLLLCGGSNNLQKCLVLIRGEWFPHSDLNEKRSWASSITNSEGTFILGGYQSPNTWEWLPTGSTTWKKGAGSIDKGFQRGCAVQGSDLEVILIGGLGTERRIMKFDVSTSRVMQIGQLNVGRYGHSCIRFQDTIIVTGGEESYNQVLASTELIDVDSLDSRLGPDMNNPRTRHGLLNLHYNNQLTILALGGEGYQNGKWNVWDSVEIWNPEVEEWIPSNDLKLSKARHSFGYLSTSTNFVCL